MAHSGYADVDAAIQKDLAREDAWRLGLPLRRYLQDRLACRTN